MKQRSKPFLIAAAAAAFLLLALVVAWVLLLPQSLTTKVTADVARKTGLTLAANAGSSLGFDNGFVLRLNDVTLAQPGEQAVPTVTARRMSVGVSLARMLGATVSADTVVLDDPVFTFNLTRRTGDAAGKGDGPSSPPSEKAVREASLTIHNGTLKLNAGAGMAMTDLNGTLARDANASLGGSLSGLLNGQLTVVSGTVDDVRRLPGEGSPLDLSISTKTNQVAFSGRMKTGGALEMDGRVLVGAQNGHDFLNWVGFDVAGFADARDIAMDSGFSLTGDKAELKSLQLSFDGMNVTGSAALSAQAARPRLDATLDFSTLNFSAYRRGAGEASGTQAPSLADAWSEKPLVFKDLGSVDGKVVLTTPELIIGALRTGKARIEATLDNGTLDARLSSDAVAMGKAEATVKMVNAGSQPDISLTLNATGVDARELLLPLTGFGALRGPADISMVLTAKGDSEARIVSTLGGKVSLSLSGGTLDGIELANLVTGKHKGWGVAQGQATALATAEISATLQDGIATLDSADAAAANLAIAATGEVDLLRQALDLEARPRLTAGATSVKLPVAVQIAGPWQNPDIDTDVKLKPKGALRALDTVVGDENVQDAAKAVGKKAKKALKKLFGN